MSNTATLNNALPSGTQVGQFVIRQTLGAGGFGITYVAVDVHLNRDVVIKENFPSFYASREHDTLTVCPSSTSNTDLFEKSLISFTNEAKMIASLKHPNIVSIFSIFDAYGTVFFAMPYHQGGSLSQFVKAFHQPNYTPLTEEQLRAYLIPILEALQYMHAHNVYHRDIKPDNILIDEKTGDPILIDFGAARELLDDKTQAATIVATFGFAAPEQIMALKIGPYTDLYALAATMYALMTGKIPERGDARLLFEDKHTKLSDDLFIQKRYSRPFLLSIDQALEPDWKKRPQTAQEWLDALQRKSSSWTAKRILSLAAILILAITFTIFFLPSSSPDQKEIVHIPESNTLQTAEPKAPAATEPPPATNPAPTKDKNATNSAEPVDPNTITTTNTPKNIQTKDEDKTPVTMDINTASNDFSNKNKPENTINFQDWLNFRDTNESVNMPENQLPNTPASHETNIATTTEPKATQPEEEDSLSHPIPLDDIRKERTWTSSRNGKQIKGKAISYDGTTVTIRINNKNIRSSKASFSKEDQGWLERHQEAIQQTDINSDTNENPVANAIKQANVNRRGKSKMKTQAKYFIFCWGDNLLKQNRFQLQAATMDAAEKDPHIQFILVSSDFPAKDKYPTNLNSTPIILDLTSYSSTGDNDYREAIKASSKAKLPWNSVIEDKQKQRWESNRNAGKTHGDFPMPAAKKRVDIPGYTPTGYGTSFFIIDAQGKRIFPTNRVYADLDNIWDAYKKLTTLPEEELQRSYDKYVQ